MESLIGKTLVHYRLLEQIGEGGMGIVYRAHDERLERDVAVKVLRPGLLSDSAARARFRREALALSRFNHTNIATIYDVGTAAGVDFLVMEYIGGQTLGEKIRSGPLAEEEVARLGIDLAEALGAAHGQGIIHRDLKPGNMRLTPDCRLKVLDFGLAKLVRPYPEGRVETVTHAMSLTDQGHVVGTLPYMAPEQLLGEEINERTDIWAAGAVLYELATARRAFPGNDQAQVIASILTDSGPSAIGADSTLSPRLRYVIAKCLERKPECRYATAQALAADLRLLGSPPVEPRVEASRPAGRRSWVVAAIGIVGALILGGLAWYGGWLPGTHPQNVVAAKKGWILVAEFEGPDPDLASATRDLVSAAIDQSEIVATVPHEQIRLALERAGKSPTTRVDADLARELAYRSAVRAVLEGKIARVGRGYSAVFRAVDAESLTVILAESAVAKDEDALIPMIGRVARRLRAGLGERRAALEATGPMEDVVTPSFEAYRLSERGYQVHASGSPREAIPIFRDALALDPDFAAAWAQLGSCYGNLGSTDSSLLAYDQALRRPRRLTMTQRLVVEAHRAITAGDLKAALESTERILQYDPTNLDALATSGNALWGLGRPAEALDRHRRAKQASPFGPSQILLMTEVIDLYSLGRVEEARELVGYLRGPQARVQRTNIEIAAHDWAVAESVAAAALRDPDATDDVRSGLLLNMASAQAGRGELQAAVGTLDLCESVARGAVAPITTQDMARRARLMLAVVTEGAIAPPEDVWSGDSSTTTLLTRGLRAALVGDRVAARRFRNAAVAAGDLARQGGAPALLEARIHGMEGRWADAARSLQPVAMQPLEVGGDWHPAGMSAIRWFLADDFEKLGRPDSAAWYLERCVSDPTSTLQESHIRGVVWPFAQRRLVLLYARMGRIEDARRHWKIFKETFTRPDPALQPMIEEARRALAEAERGARGHGPA